MTPKPSEPALHAALLDRLRGAVALAEPQAITDRIQEDLRELLAAGLTLDGRYRRTRPDAYARRLFHRDPAGRFSVVVMAWGPGQGTPIHDHAGIWCVEGVAEGTLEVERYELEEEDGEGVCRFARRGRSRAGVGSAGALIPPFEYHTLRNDEAAPAVTLHVYGGDLDACSVFEPLPGGAYLRRRKSLSFHD
jgi:predicted metal-dependent enzyme (double-stranded beta helix superfamily)